MNLQEEKGPFGFPRLTSIGPFVKDEFDPSNEKIREAIALSNLAISENPRLSNKNPNNLIAASFWILNSRTSQKQIADKFSVTTRTVGNTAKDIREALDLPQELKHIGGGLSEDAFSAIGSHEQDSIMQSQRGREKVALEARKMIDDIV